MRRRQPSGFWSETHRISLGRPAAIEETFLPQPISDIFRRASDTAARRFLPVQIRSRYKPPIGRREKNGRLARPPWAVRSVTATGPAGKRPTDPSQCLYLVFE